MKKYVFAAVIAVIAFASFAFRNVFEEKKPVLTSSTWVFTGTDPADMTDPNWYSQSASTGGCDLSGNAPCVIEVPDDITAGDAQDDLEAFLSQYENDHSSLLSIAISKKTL